jgi:hypothetical protein
MRKVTGTRGGNRIPASYLRKLYGEKHWVNAPDEPDSVPDDVRRFLERL